MKKILIYFDKRILFILVLYPFSLISQNVVNEQSDLNDMITVGSNQVELSQSRAILTDSAWMHYDDVVNYEAWGFLVSGELYEVMSKWDPWDLINYEGWMITKIKFFVTNSNPYISVKVWEGPDATEIYSQEVPDFNVNDWTIVELDSAVYFDHTKQLYFGYEVDMTHMSLGGFVTATDDGPPIDGYGNLVRWNGAWLSEYNNHNLRALISEPIIADFEADKTSVCDSSIVNFTNLSNAAGTYSWIFTGGTPSTSTLENPEVTYNIPGTYNVSLTLTYGGQSSIELKEDYITVLEIPGQISGEDLVCEYTEEVYTVDENPGSTYTWEATNGNILSGQGTHMVHVQWQDPGTAFLSLIEETMYDCDGYEAIEVTIDECTGIEENYFGYSVEVFPNPVHGDELTVNKLNTGVVAVAIFDLSGRTVLQRELRSPSTKISIGELAKGVYIFKAIAGERIETIKIIRD